MLYESVKALDETQTFLKVKLLEKQPIQIAIVRRKQVVNKGYRRKSIRIKQLVP